VNVDHGMPTYVSLSVGRDVISLSQGGEGAGLRTK